MPDPKLQDMGIAGLKQAPTKIGSLTRADYNEAVTQAIREIAERPPRKRKTIFDLRPVALIVRPEAGE